jgi:hypothetical protein
MNKRLFGVLSIALMGGDLLAQAPGLTVTPKA